MELKAIDFFCGGGGMSYGLKKAGIKVLAGIDYDGNCKSTYEANLGRKRFIKADISKLNEEELRTKLDIEFDDNNLVLVGCSPCQYWSIINTDKSKSKKSKNLLLEFKRFVDYLNPGYVIVENVPGVLRRKSESGLDHFIENLECNGYTVHFDIHNTSEYGVPQNRKRFTLIANRVTSKEVEPLKRKSKKINVCDVIGTHNGFPNVSAGHRDQSDIMNNVSGLSETNQKRILLVPKDGGDRMSFATNPNLQLTCFIGKKDSFKDSYSRLYWDKPAPTITTKFFSISNGRFVHPEENRGLSLREGAILQSFPKSYKFKGTSIAEIAKIIGNAVPPEYARRIGKAIVSNSNPI